MVRLGSFIATEFGAPLSRQVELLAGYGFDSFFVGASDEERRQYRDCRKAANDAGVFWETIHGPYGSAEGGVNALWGEGEAGDRFLSLLLRTIDDCAENHVEIMICHGSFTNVIPEPSETGGRRFDRLVAHASAAGVKIAFENLEFASPLRFLLRRYDHHPSVGLCWDIGHQGCYTPEHDVMAEFGNRILCVHIHDNLGKRDAERPTYADDLHLLPFDGTLDFAAAGRKLRSSPFSLSLMLELCYRRWPEVVARYPSAEDFLREAHSRALRLAAAMGCRNV